VFSNKYFFNICIWVLKELSDEKEGGSRVGSIDSYDCGAVALEGKKVRDFAAVIYFITFRFPQVQQNSLKVR